MVQTTWKGLSPSRKQMILESKDTKKFSRETPRFHRFDMLLHLILLLPLMWPVCKLCQVGSTLSIENSIMQPNLPHIAFKAFISQWFHARKLQFKSKLPKAAKLGLVVLPGKEPLMFVFCNFILLFLVSSGHIARKNNKLHVSRISREFCCSQSVESGATQ